MERAAVRDRLAGRRIVRLAGRAALRALDVDFLAALVFARETDDRMVVFLRVRDDADARADDALFLLRTFTGMPRPSFLSFPTNSHWCCRSSRIGNRCRCAP